MTSDDMEHVSYLGCMVFGGLLYRGDLFRDPGGRYWTEFTLTQPTGAWELRRYRLDATDQPRAEGEALMAVMEYVGLQGGNIREIDVIHLPPQRPDLMPSCEPVSTALH